MAIAVLVNWMANFIVGIGFPSLKVIYYNRKFHSECSLLRLSKNDDKMLHVLHVL